MCSGVICRDKNYAVVKIHRYGSTFKHYSTLCSVCLTGKNSDVFATIIKTFKKLIVFNLLCKILSVSKYIRGFFTYIVNYLARKRQNCAAAVAIQLVIEIHTGVPKLTKQLLRLHLLLHSITNFVYKFVALAFVFETI